MFHEGVIKEGSSSFNIPTTNNSLSKGQVKEVKDLLTFGEEIFTHTLEYRVKRHIGQLC